MVVYLDCCEQLMDDLGVTNADVRFVIFCSQTYVLQWENQVSIGIFISGNLVDRVENMI